MRPARVHVGQIIAVAAIVVSAIWSASQSAAAPLGSHPALGPAWLAVISFPVFLPWRLFGWGYAYETPVFACAVRVLLHAPIPAISAPPDSGRMYTCPTVAAVRIRCDLRHFDAMPRCEPTRISGAACSRTTMRSVHLVAVTKEHDMARRFLQEPTSHAKTRAPDRPMAGKKPRGAGRSDVWRALDYQRLGASRSLRFSIILLKSMPAAARADFPIGSEAWRAAACTWAVPLARAGAHNLDATKQK